MVAEQSRFRSTPQSALNRPSEVIDEYPMTSMLVLFGVGLGVGVLLAGTCGDKIAQGLGREESYLEKLTCQIRDVIRQSLPDELRRSFSL